MIFAYFIYISLREKTDNNYTINNLCFFNQLIFYQVISNVFSINLNGVVPNLWIIGGENVNTTRTYNIMLHVARETEGYHSKCIKFCPT